MCRYNKRSWGYKDQAINVPVNTKRFAFTVVASIGSCLQTGYCVQIEKTTNAEGFLRHLQKLKQSLRDQGTRPFLVLDNHAAQRATLCRPYLEANFRPMFLPS